jgi:transposase
MTPPPNPAAARATGAIGLGILSPELLQAALNETAHEGGGAGQDSLQMIDSTTVRAHQHAAGAQKAEAQDEGLGRSRGGFSTKIHLRVNGLGLPLAVVLTGGEVSDVKGYGPVMEEPGPEPKVMLADKGYDTDAIQADLERRGVAAVIPPKRNRKVQPIIDGHLYALRNLVERCISKLKHSRRLATRFDKTADSYLGSVLVASARLWVRHFVHTT